MRLLDLTLPTPEENLALDEALLVDGAPPTLRLWESPTVFVVLGRSSRREEEVNLPACREQGAGVYRRVSGGATILTGPGCLMYAVVLDLAELPHLADLTRAHEHVLGRVAGALRRLEPTVAPMGTSDLAVRRGGAARKVSGNSMRRTQSRLLYHGTLLYDFDLPLVGRLLGAAPRQPEYRRRRSHEEFVGNLRASAAQIKAALIDQWRAEHAAPNETLLRVTSRLVRDRYAKPEWNESR
ncbi:lipoate--protein ligase family protein [Botrimarina sp.]|uniref:lipoate--protein ligase family protein n=1 Tax=Botrimarina sp. TaxID=2795802 RepID=UPI0032EF3A4E